MPGLVVLTDRTQLPPGRDLGTLVDALAGTGLTHLLLREHDLPDDARAALAARAVAAGLRVWAAHRPVDGCVGVHLPAAAPAAAAAAEPLPWGRSCHSADDLRRAAAEGATWATLSPFAPTASKPGHGPPLPASAWRATPLPTLALGGIGPRNAADALAAGAAGLAVMGEVMRAADPAGVVRELVGVVAGAARREVRA